MHLSLIECSDRAFQVVIHSFKYPPTQPRVLTPSPFLQARPDSLDPGHQHISKPVDMETTSEDEDEVGNSFQWLLGYHEKSFISLS